MKPELSHSKIILLAAISAASTGYAVYVWFILNNFPGFSLRLVGLAILCTVLLFFFYKCVFTSKLPIFLRQAKSPARMLTTICAVFILYSVLLLVLLNPQSNHKSNPLLFPKHKVELVPLAASTPTSLTLLEITNQYANIKLNDLSYSGRWMRTPDDLLTIVNPAETDTLSWFGQPGGVLSLSFASRSDAPDVRIFLDGREYQVLNLNRMETDKYRVEIPFERPAAERTLAEVSRFGGLFVFTLGLWLLVAPKEEGGTQQQTRGSAFLYSIPMLGAWFAGFWAFYPGIYSPDSVDHLTQAMHDTYTTWHSVLYTLIIKLSLTLTNSPMPVILAQILLMAGLLAWSIVIFRNESNHSYVTWVVALLFAFSLPALLTVNSLWKDVPYSICLIALVMTVYKITAGKGALLHHKKTYFLLISLGVAIILFRDNGLAVPFATLGFLIILYPRHWRALLISIASIAVILFVFTGPVYRALNVTDSKKSFMVLTHYLWPYVSTDKQMTADEKSFYSRVLPEEFWQNYDCATVNGLIFHSKYDSEYMAGHQMQGLRYLWGYISKDPKPAIERTKCVSEIVWRVPQKNYLYLAGYDGWSDAWVIENDAGLTEASKFEWLLRDVIAPLMRHFSQHTYGWGYLLMWRPAIYLYLFIIMLLLSIYQRNDWRYFAVGIPVLVQSVTLIFTTIAQDFRYQFAIYLLGILFLCVLGMKVDPIVKNKEGGRGEPTRPSSLVNQ